MNRIWIYFFVLPLSFSCHAKDTINAIESIQIHNGVSECIEFKKNKIVNYTNLLLLNASWEVKSSTGLCGCKSAALKYSVKRKYTVKQDDNKYTYEEVLSTGIFNTLKFAVVNRESFDFVISSDNSIFKKSNLKLLIDCINPS